MQKLKEWTEGIYFSLPIQLLVVQFRYQKFTLACWAFLLLAVTNNFGETLGIPFLFLEPEYQGESNVFSMFLLGCGMGTFTTAYMIASYISHGYRFDFLALESRPFYIFYLNNIILPFTFVAIYSGSYLYFQEYLHDGLKWESVGRLGGFYLGLFMVTVLIILYFFGTNKSLAGLLGKTVAKEMKGGRTIIKKARAGLRRHRRVDYYFTGLFSMSTPDPDDRADLRQLVRILNQNHGNALFLQLILLGLIMALGLLETDPDFQLPAGASILLFFSILLMMVGALTFWTRRLGPVVLVFAVVLYFAVDKLALEKFRHPALGMNYEIPPAPYTPAALHAASSLENVQSDLQATLEVLNQWRSDYAVFHGPYKKPKAVIVCVSGGGLRAAYFTTRILQMADSVAGGRLLDHVRLFTGASGGMIGASYYRELFLRKRLGEYPHDYPLWNRSLAYPISQDLLNRVAFKIVTGMFLPTAHEQVGGSEYMSDRGWSFDDQLATNVSVFKNRRLGDYRPYEEQALIPQLILTPVIINDGRKLYISAMPASYLTRHFTYDHTHLSDGITGVDLMRFFEKQDADSLLFTTAMRMNASFPFITPYVRLPSDPPLKVMDAGLADNYGLETAARYMSNFADWYNDFADGVLLLQIRDSRNMASDVPKFTAGNFMSQMFDPIGGTYSAYYSSIDMLNEHFLHQMDQDLRGRLAYSCFQYEPVDSEGVRASLSWHLTQKEIETIEASLHDSVNMAALKQVEAWLRDE